MKFYERNLLGFQLITDFDGNCHWYKHIIKAELKLGDQTPYPMEWLVEEKWMGVVTACGVAVDLFIRSNLL